MRHPLAPGYRITTSFSAAHPGTDYAPHNPGQEGVPCFAPEKSHVVVSGTGTIEGNYVILQGHETGKFYYFGHFAERKVSTGQEIEEGAYIGILGKTGKATGIHTHCEVRDSRNTTFSGKHDPEQWFKQHTKGDDMDKQKLYQAVANFIQFTGNGFKKDYVPTADQVNDWAKRIAADPNVWLELSAALGNTKQHEEVFSRADDPVDGYPALKKQVDQMSQQYELLNQPVYIKKEK